MEQYKNRLSEIYRLEKKAIETLVAEMEPINLSKGDYITTENKTNSNVYIIKSGLWRAFLDRDGEEVTLWFTSEGEFVFSGFGYVDSKQSKYTIEVEVESEALVISRKRINELCATSIEFANLFRHIFESHSLFVEEWTLFWYNESNTKQRYLALLKREPHLINKVPLKKLASYLSITPQSLSRIRASIAKR